MLVYWFLPMILFLGIVTSYEDIKFGKIRNKWIVLALVYSIIVNIALFSMKYYDADYLIKFLINCLLSLIVGFLIWHLNLWTAGDAKLFFAFTTLIPLYKPHSYFFFLTFLSNTFVPISIFFLLYVIIKTSYRTKLSNFKKTFNLKTIFNLVLFIFGFAWIVKIIFNLLKLRSNIVLSLILIFIIYYFIERILKVEAFYISLLLSIARLVFDESIYSFQFVFHLSLSVLLFLIIRIFLFSLGSRYFAKQVRINQLKTGMMPAEMLFKLNGKYHKKHKIFSITGLAKNRKVGELLFENLPSGLSKKEIYKLKSLQRKLPFKTLKIQATLPFAPFLFFGALLTIIFNGNFIKIFPFIASKIYVKLTKTGFWKKI